MDITIVYAFYIQLLIVPHHRPSDEVIYQVKWKVE